MSSKTAYQEMGVAGGALSYFATYRIEGWWEINEAAFVPEFVEWVDQLRAKAA